MCSKGWPLYLYRVCQYVNESCGVDRETVGWHLAGEQNPLGSLISPPGHVVVDMWWRTQRRRWGRLFGLQPMPKRSQPPAPGVSILLTEVLQPKQTLKSASEANCGRCHQLSYIFLKRKKKKHIKSASCMCLAGSTEPFDEAHLH